VHLSKQSENTLEFVLGIRVAFLGERPNIADPEERAMVDEGVELIVV